MRMLLAASVLLLAAAPGAGAGKDEIPPATPDGDPVSCVTTYQINETRVHGDQVIDFMMKGGKVYRNTLPMGCPQLGFEERFLYKTQISQLCSVDTITVLTSGGGPGGISRGATCGLGQFQPVKLVQSNRR